MGALRKSRPPYLSPNAECDTSYIRRRRGRETQTGVMYDNAQPAIRCRLYAQRIVPGSLLRKCNIRILRAAHVVWDNPLIDEMICTTGTAEFRPGQLVVDTRRKLGTFTSDQSAEEMRRKLGTAQEPKVKVPNFASSPPSISRAKIGLFPWCLD